MTAGTVFLMYHELERVGRKLCYDEPGYVRYVVPEEKFREHVTLLKEAGVRGLSVGQALSDRDVGGPAGVVFTFDDGCETDLTIAAPLLKDAGFSATFYAVVNFLGRPGYLTPNALRELSDLGFEVGSHSQTHAYLPDLDEEALRVEIEESKDRLEQITGRSVAHLSCPGGRWSQRVAEVASAAGYVSVATSRPGTNLSASDRFRLARVAVMRGTSARDLEHHRRGEGLWKLRTVDALCGGLKVVLGNSSYEKFRASMLRGK